MIKKRSMVKPLATQADPGIIPEPVSLTLKNGIPVFLIESGTEDIERIEFTFDAEMHGKLFLFFHPPQA